REVLLEKVYFDSGQNRYTDNATMKRVVEGIRQCSNYRVSVHGYTDNIGPSSFNDILSQERAGSVAALLKDNGVVVSPENIIGNGIVYSCNETPEGRRENRRVEIRIFRSK